MLPKRLLFSLITRKARQQYWVALKAYTDAYRRGDTRRQHATSAEFCKATANLLKAERLASWWGLA